MLDTTSPANFKPTAEIDDLDALAKEVSKHLQATSAAAQDLVEHAIAAGDALIRAKAQVKHGEWLSWLKLCDLNEDKAERYMKLARHRAELNSAGVRNLSLSAALKLVAKKKLVSGPKAKRSTPLTHFDLLEWWSSASPEARSRFIRGVEFKPLLAAIPSSFQREAEQAIAIGPVSARTTTLLKLVLKAETYRTLIMAVDALKRELADNGYDLDDVEIHLNNQNHRCAL